MNLRLCALLLAVPLLAGCRSGPETSIEVTGPGQADVVVAAVLTGDAAAVVDSSLQSQIVNTVTTLSGQPVTVERDKVQFRAWARIPASGLAKTREVTGVSSVQLTSLDGDTTRVSIVLHDPSRLRQAIAGAVSHQPEPTALHATLLEETSVSVHVSFPGPVTATTGAETNSSVSGSTATLQVPLSSRVSGTWTVTGSNAPSHRFAPVPLAAGAGLVLLAAGLHLTRRRAR